MINNISEIYDRKGGDFFFMFVDYEKIQNSDLLQLADDILFSTEHALNVLAEREKVRSLDEKELKSRLELQNVRDALLDFQEEAKQLQAEYDKLHDNVAEK